MKALFFDLDGTMWDAVSQLTEAYNQAMTKGGYPYRFTLPTVKSYMGLTPEETVALAFPALSLSEGLHLFHLMYQEELVYLSQKPGILYPRLEETLSLLSQRYPLYLVSNADKGYIETFFKGTGLGHYFRGHLAAGDTGLAKWQNIQLLKAKEKIDDVIYIGDTNKDKTEAGKAGVKFIHAAYGFGKIEPDEYKIDHFDELPEMAEKLFH